MLVAGATVIYPESLVKNPKFDGMVSRNAPAPGLVNVNPLEAVDVVKVKAEPLIVPPFVIIVPVAGASVRNPESLVKKPILEGMVMVIFDVVVDTVYFPDCVEVAASVNPEPADVDVTY